MLRRLFHRRRIVPGSGDVAVLAAAPCRPWPGSGLHVCPGCRKPFVYPVEWCASPSGEEVWLLLRCGQCQTWREVTVPSGVAARLKADTELARSSISHTLRGLERRRMALEITTLRTALERDLIDAADFRPRLA
jgi:hypothetical protein